VEVKQAFKASAVGEYGGIALAKTKRRKVVKGSTNGNKNEVNGAMQIHWVFNDCAESVKRQMRAYWEKKLPRLEKLLQHFRPDLQYLGVTVYQHAQSPRYEVRAVLHLPTATLVAEEEDKDFRLHAKPGPSGRRDCIAPVETGTCLRES
jgi:hypothetical protein